VKNRLLNPNSFASGIAKERSENSYAYTGMRQNAVGGTTFHHARDYSATLRGWIETDQFMDPWSDLGLSMDPATRDRSGYAGGNPVGNVDTDGHRFTDGDGHESLPTAHGIYHMESNSSTYSCHCSYYRHNDGSSTWGSGSSSRTLSPIRTIATVAWKRIESAGEAKLNTRQAEAGWAFDDAVADQSIGMGLLYNSTSGVHHESDSELGRKRREFLRSMVPSTPWGKKGLDIHWREHASDFDGIDSPEAYDAAAREFYAKAGTHGIDAKIDGIEHIDIDPGRGRISLYDSSTNTFGSFDLSGNPKTFYKPTRGTSYWDEEIAGDEPPPEFEFPVPVP
jgi:RHS repeat-associated protein